MRAEGARIFFRVYRGEIRAPKAREFFLGYIEGNTRVEGARKFLGCIQGKYARRRRAKNFGVCNEEGISEIPLFFIRKLIPSKIFRAVKANSLQS